jgi:hypothetical protein
MGWACSWYGGMKEMHAEFWLGGVLENSRLEDQGRDKIKRDLKIMSSGELWYCVQTVREC